MIKIYKLIAIFTLVIVVMGCNNEDPLLPTPGVNFRTNTDILEVGKSVVFENLSTNASSYKWDFGDGQTSTEISPTKTYDERGTYTVKLVAYTEDNQSDSVSRSLDVGERVMTDIIINSIPFLNPDKLDWDNPTGMPDSTKYPDFILALSPQDDYSRLILTPPVYDLPPYDLPVGFTLDQSGDPYVLTDEDWEMTFVDFDGEDIENAQDSDFEVMEVITFNPIEIPTSTVNENGEGLIQVSINQYSVDIFFQIE
jgi:PKD repeat protein